MEEAEKAFADMATKKLGDVVSLDDEALKSKNALLQMAIGEALSMELLEEHYGKTGTAASIILDQVFEGELSGMAIKR